MIEAAENSHETIVWLCHERGSTQFLRAAEPADKNGYENIARLCRVGAGESECTLPNVTKSVTHSG